MPAGPGPLHLLRDEDSEEEELGPRTRLPAERKKKNAGLRRARTGLCISWEVVCWLCAQPGFKPRYEEVCA